MTAIVNASGEVLRGLPSVEATAREDCTDLIRLQLLQGGSPLRMHVGPSAIAEAEKHLQVGRPLLCLGFVGVGILEGFRDQFRMAAEFRWLSCGSLCQLKLLLLLANARISGRSSQDHWPGDARRLMHSLLEGAKVRSAAHHLEVFLDRRLFVQAAVPL